MKYKLTLLFIAVFSVSWGQNELEYAKMIDVKDIEQHIKTLASDDYAGRETGKEGQQKAASYIIEQFKKKGAQPGNNNAYQQFFTIAQVRLGGTISIGSEVLQYGSDFIPMFFNYAVDQKYQQVRYVSDCKELKGDFEQTLFVVDGDACEKSMNVIYKTISRKNAAGLIYISESFDKYESELENFHGRAYLIDDTTFTKTKVNNPPIVLLPPQTKRLFQDQTSLDVTLNINSIEILEGSNVPAIIEGTDPELKNEYVVLTAHYDHLGVSGEQIFNGADDNGTGTAGLIEIAEAFAQAKQDGNGPKRSILIMPVAGEEKGLLGSSYYVQNPTIPLENIITDLNIDMIGRVDEAHQNDPNYIYLIGSDRLSSDLHELSESVNKEYSNFTIDYTYNRKDDPNRYYYRSDHYNFAKNGIPSIFYFSGIHEDYHQPTDTVDKIDFDRVTKVTQLVFYTAWKLANQEERPQLD